MRVESAVDVNSSQQPISVLAMPQVSALRAHFFLLNRILLSCSEAVVQ